MKREIKIDIVNGNGDSRTYSLKIPTAGQLVDVENFKAVYTQGNYKKIMMTGTIQSNDALDLVDMNAYLKALCPNLLEDWEVKDLFDLDIFDIKKIKSVYDSKVVPWIEEWSKAFRDVVETKDEPKIG